MPRLIRALVGLCIGIVLGVSWGLSYATTTYTAVQVFSITKQSNNGTCTSNGDGAAGAIQCVKDAWNATHATSPAVSAPSGQNQWSSGCSTAASGAASWPYPVPCAAGGYILYYRFTDNNIYSAGTLTATAFLQCPYGGSLSSGQCVGAPDCAAGEVRGPSGQCVGSCPAVGTESWSSCNGTGCSVSTVCQGGCQWKGGDAIWSGRGDLSGSVQLRMVTSQTVGQSCSVGSDTQLLTGTSPVPPTPKPGECYGTVNGIGTYLPCDQSSSTKTSNTCKDANGNPCDPSAPPGDSTSQSSTSKTVCNGSSCSTTTTTTNNVCTGGACTTTTGVSTTTKGAGDPTDMGTFCKENPDVPMCKMSSFVGTCVTNVAPSCDGDAVQCATAKAVHELNCDLTRDTPQATLADQVFSGSDPLSSTFPTHPSQVTVGGTFSGTSIDQSSFLSGGGLSDKVVSIGARGSFTIPFSSANSVLAIMGNIVVAFSLLAAARIVGVI